MNMTKLVLGTFCVIALTVFSFCGFSLFKDDMRLGKVVAENVYSPILGEQHMDVDASKTKTVDLTGEVVTLLTKERARLFTQATDYYAVVSLENGDAYRFKMNELDWKMLKEGDTIALQQLQEYRTNGKAYETLRYKYNNSFVSEVTTVDLSDTHYADKAQVDVAKDGAEAHEEY